jgi:DNA-binding CsgD family transcriptional regulator
VVDKSLLNDVELRYLDLLAEGHTVKSISILTGKSVAAINERLRNARRKTGVGSSRELARLTKAQETRHEKIRLEVPAADFENGILSGALSVPPQRKGFLRMSTFIIAMSATIAAATLGGPSVGPTAIKPLPDGSPQTRLLNAHLRALTAASAARNDSVSTVIDQQTMQVLRRLDLEVGRLPQEQR